MAPMLETIRRASFPMRRCIAGVLYPSSRGCEAGPRQSYSAHGEDLIALSWLTNYFKLRAAEILYLDIGASDPIVLSNTFYMYKLGARGVLVEPDPELIGVLRAERPRDIVLEAGAAFDDQRSATLSRFEQTVFNTFKGDAENADSRIVAPLIPINEVITEHFSRVPDFLSIDAEGYDFDILKSMDLTRHRPKIICIELSRSVQDVLGLLSPHGYEFITRTPDNALFMRS